MSRTIKRWLGCLVAAALICVSQTAVANQLSDILDRGTIKVGVPENFPPFGSVGSNFEHEGYDVDVAKMLANDLGVALELVPITSKQRIPYLTSGRVDLVISSMGANPTRAKSIWFSSAYAPFFSAVFAHEDRDIDSADDLAGLRVGVTGAPSRTLNSANSFPTAWT